ncbi:MAG: Lrp/AsnC family transcriptional regulator [Proteobacteria bacterium]|nr:Lrp/AsnC family transcriptional regulator [Pseudomonadota bacterium]
MTSTVATAYVLISIKAGAAREVFSQLQKLKNVLQMDVVTGPYDMIVTVQGSDFNQIGTLVMDKIQTIEGLTNSITCNVIRLEV